MSSTRIARHVDAPRAEVYRLLLDGDAVAAWMLPDGIQGVVHRFEPQEGGGFSITADFAGETPGSDPQHDAYYGRFVSLVPDERVIEKLEFVTTRAELAGEMTVSFVLADAAGGGTNLLVVHDDVPAGLSEEDNEAGWRAALDKLTALAERGAAR
ncbi:SRPBCC domain-containing protein [Nocardia thailandica]